MNSINKIWEGIYSTFDEAPVDDKVFNSDKWLKKQVKTISNILQEETIAPISRNYPLTSVVAMFLRNNKSIKVLDYGGGLGKEYLNLINSINSRFKIEFTIVETDEIVKQGRVLFKDDSNINFSEKIPEEKNVFDLIHVGSSLQYVEDWREFISRLVSLGPEYLLLSDVLAGDIPSFVTVQLYYGENIRVQFLNKKELFSFLREFEYELILEELYDGDIFSNNEPLPMNNFPPEYQLKYSQNYIFSKIR